MKQIKNQGDGEQNPSGERVESPARDAETFNEVEIFVNGESAAKAVGPSSAVELLEALVKELRRAKVDTNG